MEIMLYLVEPTLQGVNRLLKRLAAASLACLAVSAAFGQMPDHAASQIK